MTNITTTSPHCGVSSDIEDRKFAEMLLTGENRVLEMLAKGNPLPNILDSLCRLVEDISPGYLVSILLLDAKENRLKHGAAPNLPNSYTDRVEGYIINNSWGPCGKAAFKRKPVIITDINRCDLSAEYRELAASLEMRACWSTPIVSSSGGLLGTFAIYSREKGGPSSKQQSIIDQMTHLAAIAIERSWAEEKLRRSEAYLTEAQKLSLTGSFSWRPGSGEITWSDETYRIYGYSPAIKPTMELARQRIHPDDLVLFAEQTRKAPLEGKDFEFEHRLLLPGGAVKHVSVVARAAKDDAGKLIEYYGVVMDVTARDLAQQSLESALREMQSLKDHLQMAVDTIPGLVWTALPDGHIDFLNQRWLEYTGLTPDNARGWGWQVAIHPDDVDNLVNHWKSVLKSGRPGETEARLRRFDGAYRWFLFRGVPLYDRSGKLVKWYGQTTDIDERKRVEALLAAEKKLLEMIARGDALPAVLDAFCRFGEELSGGVLVSILLVSDDGKRLRHGAAPNLPRSYTEAIDGGLIGPRAGSCGTAVYRRKTVVVTDIATDPLWHDYRHLALRRGLRACWSAPIFSTTRDVLGTFALYSREATGPTPEQQSVIEQFARLASIAIERTRAQEALRLSETYLAEAQRLSLTGSFGWKVATGDLVLSAETYCILGYDRSMKPTLELVFSRVHPEDIVLVRQQIDSAARSGSNLDFEHRLLMPDGAVKHVHVVARALIDESGKREFVGAVMDVTDRKKSQEALHASEQFARGQVTALTSMLDALARETSVERIVEQVLRTITGQLGAHSCSVWLRDENSDLVVFEFAFESGKFKTKSDAPLAAISPSLPVDAIWPWPEVFRTGKPFLMDDIRQGPDFPWRAHVLAQGIVSILIVPMLMAGNVAGVIGIRFTGKREFRPEEMDLAQALANQAMLAMQLTRLSSRSREAAVAAERNRMARDIHDTLAQGFTGIIVQLEAAADAASKGLTKEAEKHVSQAGDLARESLKEARRSVQALRPLALEQKTLPDALDDLIRKSAIQADFVMHGQPFALPTEWDENILRIGQEALTNTLRHAQASEFTARLSFADKEVRLELRDNGRGFDPEYNHDGYGLLGMRERVEGMGGELTIESITGMGTMILVVLPISSLE